MTDQTTRDVDRDEHARGAAGGPSDATNEGRAADVSDATRDAGSRSPEVSASAGDLPDEAAFDAAASDATESDAAESRAAVPHASASGTAEFRSPSGSSAANVLSVAELDAAATKTPHQRPTIWQLAWPSTVSNLLFSIGGIIAMKVVGGLGASAVAAVTSGNQIYWGLQAILMAISTGTTALAARAWGADQPDEAVAITKVSLVLAGITALLMTIPGVLFPVQIAAIFGLDAHTTEVSGDYIRWLSVFSLAMAVNLILGAALRAVGDAMTPLWVGIATNIVNLSLIYLFVYGGAGFPSLGVAGAAMANGVAMTVAALIMWVAWQKQVLMLPWNRSAWWRKDLARELLHIGYPAGIEQLVFRAGFFLFLGIIGTYYGTGAYAAYGIGVNILSLCMVVGFGFSISASTLVGQALGANDTDQAAKAGWQSLWYAAVSMTVVGIAVILFARPMAAFMIQDEIVIDYTVAFIYILGAMLPLMAIEFALGGALRGAGDTRFPLYATMVGLLGMRCGLAVLFAFLDLSVVWIYAALIGDYLIKGAMLLWRFRSGRWRHLVRKEWQSA